MPVARARGLVFMPFLCLVAKKWRKKTDFSKLKSQVCLFAKRENRAKRGRKRCDARTFPPGPPLAADAGLPRRVVCTASAWQGLLLSRFCLKFVRTMVRSTWQRLLLYCLRATSVFAFLHQNANAKTEFAQLRANMSVAPAQRRLRAH